MSEYLILTPSLEEHDAVTNDCLIGADALTKKGHAVSLFAEHARGELHQKIVGRTEVRRLLRDPAVKIIYHHSTYWDLGIRYLATAEGPIYCRYHNVTPGDYFAPYNEAMAADLAHGTWQTHCLAAEPKITHYLCASRYNSEVFLANGNDPSRISIVPPFHRVSDFARAQIDVEMRDSMDSDKVNLLSVGRLVPHKGIAHLLRVLDRYIGVYGDQVCLHLVGGVFKNPDYVAELEELATLLRLKDYLRIHGKISLDALGTLYRMCDVLISLSDHEGFCVPVVEAQFHGLPVVALDRGAVGETLGDGQLALPQLDYGLFVAAIHQAAADSDLRDQLREKGHHNLTRFTHDKIREQFLAAMGA